MELVQRTLITIVTEGVIERILTKDLKKLGAHGYTITEAWGDGSHGLRADDSEQDRNIQIKVVCERNVAEHILEYLSKNYYKNYAMVAYLSEVEVLRGEKF